MNKGPSLYTEQLSRLCAMIRNVSFLAWVSGWLFTVGYTNAGGWELSMLFLFWPLVLGSRIGGFNSMVGL